MDGSTSEGRAVLPPPTFRPLPPFRFGVQVRGADSAGELVALARRAEALGYDVLTVPDHFPTGLAPFSALATVAAHTERLRVGIYVAANDFRHPVVLAKEAATLDLLSGGRVELGVGAGWHKEEYDAVGIPFERPGARVDRLEEAVALLRMLLGPEGDAPVSFAGEHYRVTGLELTPRPAQPGGVPLLVGGGSRRLLTMAAERADIVAMTARALPGGGLDVRSVSAEAAVERAGWVTAAAEAAGRGDGRALPERNLYLYGVTETGDPGAAVAGWVQEGGLSAEDLLASPHFLCGSVEEMAAELVGWRARLGVSYVTVLAAQMEAAAPLVARLAGR